LCPHLQEKGVWEPHRLRGKDPKEKSTLRFGGGKRGGNSRRMWGTYRFPTWFLGGDRVKIEKSGISSEGKKGKEKRPVGPEKRKIDWGGSKTRRESKSPRLISEV